MTAYYFDPEHPDRGLQRAPDRGPAPVPDEPVLGTGYDPTDLTDEDGAVLMAALEYLAEDVAEDPDEFQPGALDRLRTVAAKVRSGPVAYTDPIHLEDR